MVTCSGLPWGESCRVHCNRTLYPVCYATSPSLYLHYPIEMGNKTPELWCIQTSIVLHPSTSFYPRCAHKYSQHASCCERLASADIDWCTAIKSECTVSHVHLYVTFVHTQSCQLSRIERESPAWTWFLPLSRQAYKISCITNISPLKSCETYKIFRIQIYVSKSKERKVCITLFFFFCLSLFS